MSILFALILTLLAIFLILLVLVQRGRGGGLAGALGGMGGSSAFGAKAGDVFTRITIITAAIWIFISIIVFFWAKHRGDALDVGDTLPAASQALDMMPQDKAGDDKSSKEVGPTTGKATDTAPATAPPAEDTGTLPPTATQATPPADSSAPAASEGTPPAGTDTAPPADTEKK
jgi:preprotein translocase subunit SecG